MLSGVGWLPDLRSVTRTSSHVEPILPVLGLADLHLHTRASDGLATARELVERAERDTDLDVIAITDHDDTLAALEARDYATRCGFRVQVIPGVEVTTRDGHLLALFVDERPPALRGLAHTAEWVLNHGGLCIAPHPFTRWTHSLNVRALSFADGLVSGVEVLNASLAGRGSRPHAVAYAERTGLARIGASDAHVQAVVGLARTRFAGRSALDLRRAIEERTTEAIGRFASPAELAIDAIPQFARSMVHLPLRRLARFATERTRQTGRGLALRSRRYD
jgi:predicted metal-dependent phosphoesterase TrpH